MLEFLEMRDATDDEAVKPSIYDRSPLRDHLLDSWNGFAESGEPSIKVATVATNDVSKVRSQLSGIATRLEIGVHCHVIDNGDGTSSVVYSAKERTIRHRKAK